MEVEWVTPKVAVEWLVATHRTVPKRARGALIGGLACGQIAWSCRQWREIFTSDAGATFNASGGATDEEPHNGWPSDFWQIGLVADDVCWKNNCFVSYGTVTLLDAPSAVLRWLRSNGEAIACWSRYADNVTIRRCDVREVLGGSGWGSFIGNAPSRRRAKPRSRHYQDALIDLIRLVSQSNENPLTDQTTIMEALSDAFQNAGHDIPDRAEMVRLTRAIWKAITPADEGLPPTA